MTAFFPCLAVLAAIVSIASQRAALAIAPPADAVVEGDADADAASVGTGPYMRVVDVDDSTVRLDMAVRLFAPSQNSGGGEEEGGANGGGGPVIALAGAVHIADAAFYELLQQFLEAQDLVLFEGVKPPGVGSRPAASDAERVDRTGSTIRFVAMMLARHAAAHEGRYPESLPEFVEALGEESPRQAEWVASSLADAWGRPLVYALSGDAGADFSLVSYGADGQPGGEGVNADLAFADQEPLSMAEIGEGGPNLQQRLASALGLVFQLEAMSHEGPNYRNSDMSLDQVQEEIEAAGGDAEMLFRILDNSSFMSRVIGFMLGMIERNPQAQAMMKVVLMDMLALTMEGDGLMGLGGAPPALVKTMEVIVVNRNRVVIDDLRAALASKSGAEPSSIAAVYGAGHMADLERRLVDELGYRPVGGFWLPAITVDLSEAGIKRSELNMMRQMTRRMLEAQARRPAPSADTEPTTAPEP